MEINLFENEFGFSDSKLSFPSISACRAIVYQTANGLFGVHQASGPSPEKFEAFGRKFAKFVNDHRLGNGGGVNMYGITYLGIPNTGYGPRARQEHYGEMGAMAKALQFTGSIRSYDLSPALGQGEQGSAYVEVVVNGGGCDVFVSKWPTTSPAQAPFDPARRDDHKFGLYNRDDFSSPKTMLVKMDADNPKKLEPWSVVTA
ncbi:hypothetical protein FKG94_09490 [Exilibacterium tricleocarpae]|uniref:Uncharacterized protein n=1 Tax=Exilibacterium tricleocarpae TaxID=2591008 RepID=A0A545TVR7_9GAMM|nr:hypothetical protein [Exilibacterium tricleocarpae]TQV81315.1 hypothetical protein FKG94_09490 [Exilibacterium tricleocarpae]